MCLMESPITSNLADSTPTTETYKSTACAYFAFVDFSDKELICLEVGAYICITLLDYTPAKTHIDTDSSKPDNAQKDNSEKTDNAKADNETDNENDNIQGDLGNKDRHNVFELE
jgi:hypothetical protein